MSGATTRPGEVENRELTSEQWKQKTSGLDELGRRILEEYGLHVQFHSTPTAMSATSQTSSDSSSRPIPSG